MEQAVAIVESDGRISAVLIFGQDIPANGVIVPQNFVGRIDETWTYFNGLFIAPADRSALTSKVEF